MKNTPITENHLFVKAYNKGKSVPGRYVVVYVLKDRQNERFRRADPMHRPLNRLGLTVGKKLGGAVERNRAKRLMREAYRRMSADTPAGYTLMCGYLLVIAARTKILEADSAAVSADLQNVLVRSGILVPSAASQKSSAPEA